MHFGATLRLLRLESGLGLRDLARRLNVSGAYLSRVENGLDSIPTSARLEAIASALQIPAPLLLDLAHRVSPLVVDYVDAVPEAGTLLLEIAHRRLGAHELCELRDFLNERFPSKDATAVAAPGFAELLTPATVIVRFSCSAIEDVIDVAVGRLEHETPSNRYAIAADLKQREREVSSAIGAGVAVLCANTARETPAAVVVVTLAKPLAYDTPDREPLRLVVVLAAPRNSPQRRIGLARVARLAARGLSSDLAEVESPAVVISHLARVELLG